MCRAFGAFSWVFTTIYGWTLAANATSAGIIVTLGAEAAPGISPVGPEHIDGRALLESQEPALEGVALREFGKTRVVDAWGRWNQIPHRALGPGGDRFENPLEPERRPLLILGHQQRATVIEAVDRVEE